VKQGPTQCQAQADVQYALVANTPTAHHMQARVPCTVFTAKKENSRIMHKQSTTLRVAHVLQVLHFEMFLQTNICMFSNHLRSIGIFNHIQSARRSKKTLNQERKEEEAKKTRRRMI
jgi:hypothetical protein